MNSVVTVQDGGRRSKRSTASPVVRVMTDDGIDEFARLVVQGRAGRVFIVSPWISAPSSLPALERIIDDLGRRRGRLIVVTRPACVGAAQLRAVQELVAAPSVSVHELGELHAKLYMAELRGGRVAAYVGSANLTTSSQLQREAGVLLVVKHRSRLARDLGKAVHDLRSSGTCVGTTDIHHLQPPGAGNRGLPNDLAWRAS